MMIDPPHSGPTCNGYNSGDHARNTESPTVNETWLESRLFVEVI
jgi:hypothetical protein